ncbi:MAG TPA: EF-P lysine aminoacylase EpmA [Stellaceae bacterium]|nr:EF-P lysine aminoacylase EpmA [Stellaceae bacterium]
MGTVTEVPWWRPDRFALRRDRLMRRAEIVRATRAWFAEADFVEVTTPALQVSPGLEPHLSAFETVLAAPEGGVGPRFLHTSPEFAMKKLLVAGIERPYQLASVFRNGERGATHHPEFTMLEWYRAHAGYEQLIEDCEALLRAALRAAGRPAFSRAGLTAKPWEPFERLTVADAFQRHCGIDLLSTAPDPTRPNLALLAAASAPLGIRPHDGDSWDDLFFRIMLERIEPLLGIGRPTVLLEYPVSMAALARAKPSDPRVAERFELYVCGVELANAFGELTDATVQRARFEADTELKQRLYGRRYPIDEDFLAALDHGLPDSAGIALGFDRLVMLATGADRIDDVLWAPVV